MLWTEVVFDDASRRKDRPFLVLGGAGSELVGDVAEVWTGWGNSTTQALEEILAETLGYHEDQLRDQLPPGDRRQ